MVRLLVILLTGCALSGTPVIFVENKTDWWVATGASVTECDASGSDEGAPADYPLWVSPGDVGMFLVDGADLCVDMTFSGQTLQGDPVDWWGAYKFVLDWHEEATVQMTD